MPRRTSPQDADKVFDANDLEELVHDKRADWRASGANARRRQRRYKKLLMAQISKQGPHEDAHGDDAD